MLKQVRRPLTEARQGRLLARHRTFATISLPDASKTTLIEHIPRAGTLDIRPLRASVAGPPIVHWLWKHPPARQIAA
jgi:hypothetical protein